MSTASLLTLERCARDVPVPPQVTLAPEADTLCCCFRRLTADALRVRVVVIAVARGCDSSVSLSIEEVALGAARRGRSRRVDSYLIPVSIEKSRCPSTPAATCARVGRSPKPMWGTGLIATV